MGFHRLHAIGMRGVGQRRERQQQERQLERTPASVLRLVELIDRYVAPAPHFECVQAAHALDGHRSVGEAESCQRLFVVLQGVDALLQARLDFLTPIQCLRGLRVIPNHILADALALLFDPRRVVLRQYAQGVYQLIGAQCGEPLHVEQTTVHHLLHRRAVDGVEAWCLRDLHLVLRQHGGAHLGCQRHVVRRFSVDGDAMSDRELHAVAVDHLQRFTLRIVPVDIQHGAAAEDGPLDSFRFRTHDQFRLEQPRRVPIGIGFFLRIDQEQRHQAISVGVLGANGTLYPHRWTVCVWCLMGNHAFGERQHQLPATGNALPDLGFLAIGSGQFVFVVWYALVAAPTRFDLDVLGVAIDAESHAEAARHQRLIAGSVDLVRSIRFGFHPPGRRPKLGTRFVLTGHDGVGGFLDILLGQRAFKPFDTASSILARCQLANQIAVAHAHVHDVLVRATSRAEQVVHHGQLQQFADVGPVLDRRHAAHGLMQSRG